VNSAATQPERLAAPEWFVRAVAQPTLSHCALFEGRGPVVIPEAGHHLMMDQPLALVASLRSLLQSEMEATP